MSVQDQDQEEIIDFLETESAGFADQEQEEETIVEQEEEETIVEQEEETIEDHEEETAEDSHPSEIEDIIEEVNRVELRVESTTVPKPSAIESDSDSDSYSDSSSGTSSNEPTDSEDHFVFPLHVGALDTNIWFVLAPWSRR